MFFLLKNYKQLKDLQHSKIFFTGFYLFLAGWVLTVLEGLFWANLLNLLEHLFYATSSILILFWSWRLFGRRGEQK
ncbi:MAG: hypothetical protein KGY74_05075 [Candidatus Cloacimonetes bacterium]|nr:hypothetical protein [Candidatus Cloacimonadota bacterium]